MDDGAATHINSKAYLSCAGSTTFWSSVIGPVQICSFWTLRDIDILLMLMKVSKDTKRKVVKLHDTFTSAPRMSIETWILRSQQIKFILLPMEEFQKVILRLSV